MAALGLTYIGSITFLDDCQKEDRHIIRGEIVDGASAAAFAPSAADETDFSCAARTRNDHASVGITRQNAIIPAISSSERPASLA
ncbi:MAG: hypothetical protein JJ926_17780 [Roseitalea sp.]|nr:hypothetical protein [Roseitalea sp.]MBO6953730.1 hypothetical protein [Rhizobiaceae bacterium]MBO6594079.1 hypothetical protein [Roseitalea sp.]MBO6601488.1 hypothetical protein [Roseitalea sp.]MBO6613578.1 hypothetical protein [Roseitalea sp.]